MLVYSLQVATFIFLGFLTFGTLQNTAFESIRQWDYKYILLPAVVTIYRYYAFSQLTPVLWMLITIITSSASHG